MRLLLTISLALAIIPLPWLDEDPPPPAAGPVFSGAALVRPEGYHTWPLVGASLGLSYAETPQGSGPGAFHRVYMNPSSYEAYGRTGTTSRSAWSARPASERRSAFSLSTSTTARRSATTQSGSYDALRTSARLMGEERTRALRGLRRWFVRPRSGDGDGRSAGRSSR